MREEERYEVGPQPITFLERAAKPTVVTEPFLCVFFAFRVEHHHAELVVLENLLRLFSRNLRKANTEIGVLS